MKTALAILTALLLSASVAHAQPAAPTGPPPVLWVVMKAKKDKGTVELVQTVVRYVPYEEEKVIVKNGEKVKVKVTNYKTEYVQENAILNVAGGRVITPDGKQLPIDDVWKRLTKNTVLAVAHDGNTPAQAYLRAFSPETLILIPGPMKN